MTFGIGVSAAPTRYEATRQRHFVRRVLAKPSGWMGGTIMLLLVAVAVFAPFIAPYPYNKINTRAGLHPPSWQYLFGTDTLGRDMFSRVVYGAQPAVQIGLGATGMAVGGGLLIGLVSGYVGGRVDSVLMGAMDVFLAFPAVLIAFLVLAVLGSGFGSVMIAIGLSPIPGFARLVRGQVLSIRAKEYVLAAHAIGCSPARIMSRTILPNILTPVVVLGTVLFPDAILAAAGLTFIGLGAQPPAPDWGMLLVDGQAYLTDAPWLVNFPGLAILLVVVGSNLLGGAIRETLAA